MSCTVAAMVVPPWKLQLKITTLTTVVAKRTAKRLATRKGDDMKAPPCSREGRVVFAEKTLGCIEDGGAEGNGMNVPHYHCDRKTNRNVCFLQRSDHSTACYSTLPCKNQVGLFLRRFCRFNGIHRRQRDLKRGVPRLYGSCEPRGVLGQM